MVSVNRLILRKFKNIAGSRYEEILNSYRDFFLTEEEMVIPRFKSILIAIDRYSSNVPEGVFKLIEHYSPERVLVTYVVDENTCRLIRETLGEEDADKFREKETALAQESLYRVRVALKALDVGWEEEVVFADKTTHVETLMGKYDVLIIGKQYGLESAKTHHISPLVFRIVQHVAKPVVLY